MNQELIRVLFIRELFSIKNKVFKAFWYDSYGRPLDEEIIEKFEKGKHHSIR